MRFFKPLALISLILLGTACSEESVADKYLSQATVATDTSDTDTNTDDNTDTTTTTEGDATAGQELVTSNNCASCHNGTIAQTVLDSTAVDKLTNAKSQSLHNSFKSVFEAGSTDRANLEAYLKTL